MPKEHPQTKLPQLRALAGKRPMSQADFAALVGISQGTLGSMENRKAPLGRLAADKIEAALGVDADALINGKLLNLDGKTYTKEDWVFATQVTLNPDELGLVARDIETRVNLLLGAVGRGRVRFIATRIRQTLEELKSGENLSDDSIDAAGQRMSRTVAENFTVADVRNNPNYGKKLSPQLSKFKATDKVHATMEHWFTWPESRPTLANITGGAKATWVIRITLPDGSVLTHRFTAKARPS